MKDDLSNKKITVLGMAKSGIAVVRLLSDAGAKIFVSDSGDSELLAAATAELDAMSIHYETGGHTEHALDADFIVTSPGVPEIAGIIGKAVKAELPIYSELECASWFTDGKIAAITGSNGKTTCTALLGEMMKQSFDDVRVGGNIGTPFRRTENGHSKIAAAGTPVAQVANMKTPIIAAILLTLMPMAEAKVYSLRRSPRASLVRAEKHLARGEWIVKSTKKIKRVSRRIRVLARSNGHFRLARALVLNTVPHVEAACAKSRWRR